MKDYSNVTYMEAVKKEFEMLDDLGRTKGYCTGVSCGDCPFYKENNQFAVRCEYLKVLYPNEYLRIIMEHESKVDWSKVPVDTKILVYETISGKWLKRYFAFYKNGRVYSFNGGLTSFTARSNKDCTGWSCAKLYKEDEDEPSV